MANQPRNILREYDLEDTRRLLDEINAAISKYDPVLRNHARDILLSKAFGSDHNSKSETRDTDEEPGRAPSAVRRSFESLMASWQPRTHGDRALLAAYYLQMVLRVRVVTGNQINRQLKKHGLGITNVSVSTNENIRTVPPRMKKIKRVRKRNGYSITKVGAEYVRNKLQGFE
jgi:hypothetical protein